MNQPQLILLDCDGTLTDSHAAIVRTMQHAFNGEGLACPDDDAVSQVIGLSLSRAIATLLSPEQQQPELIESLAQRYRHGYHDNEKAVRLFPGVVETLNELRRRGYWLGVVTGKSRNGLLRVMDRFGLADHFLVWRTADCTHSKPHPAMVLECMEELGVNAARTSVVGDASFDMEMARAANVEAVGVTFGVASAEALTHAGAHLLIDRFPELLDHYGERHDPHPIL